MAGGHSLNPHLKNKYQCNWPSIPTAVNPAAAGGGLNSPSSVWDFTTRGFWYPLGSWNPYPVATEL